MSISRAYAGLLNLLAIIAGLLVAFMLFAVIYDALLRVLGFPSAKWANPLTEYALPYITLLAAPWVVRKRGHIMIESLTGLLGPSGKRFLEVFVCLFCILLCLMMTYYATVLMIENYQRGERDIRSITIPLWLLFVPFPIGLGLSAIEFARFLFGTDRLLTSRGTSAEGI